MNKTYDATVTPDGKWWMVHIPSVSGLTQARRLSEAETTAKELISATEDVRVEDVDVDVRIEVGAVEVSAWSG